MSLAGSGNSRYNDFTAINVSVTGQCEATVTISASVSGSGNYAYITIGGVTKTYSSGTYTLTGTVDGNGRVIAGGHASNDSFVNVSASATIKAVG